MKAMKRVIASLLATTMVMSMSMTAFAEEESNEETGTTESSYNYTTPESVDNEGAAVSFTTNMKKIYDVVGNHATGLYPHETLTFTSEPDADNNPDQGVANLSDLSLVMGDTTELSFVLPQYSKAGAYVYTLSENMGDTQGVTYNPENGTISITVNVVYDYADEATKYGSVEGDGHHLAVDIVAVSLESDGTTKNDTITNKYELGNLTVSKTVEGNLASKDQAFTIDVTFTSDQIVLSDILLSDGQIVSYENDWTYNEDNNIWTAVKTIEIKDSESVQFVDIPVGVAYAVEENKKHLVEDPTGDNQETGYTVKYTIEDNAAISTANEADTVIVTNTKNTEVNTGIILDSAPYILLLAFAAAGMFVVINKKREEEF